MSISGWWQASTTKKLPKNSEVVKQIRIFYWSKRVLRQRCYVLIHKSNLPTGFFFERLNVGGVSQPVLDLFSAAIWQLTQGAKQQEQRASSTTSPCRFEMRSHQCLVRALLGFRKKIVPNPMNGLQACIY